VSCLACYGPCHMQEFVERGGAFRNAVTGATVDKELRVMIEDIDDEKRLLRGTGRLGCVHANLIVSDPRQRNRRRLSLGAGQKADICSGNSQRCKIVFQRTAHNKTSRFDGRPHHCQLRHYETLAGELTFRKTGHRFRCKMSHHRAD